MLHQHKRTGFGALWPSGSWLPFPLNILAISVIGAAALILAFVLEAGPASALTIDDSANDYDHSVMALVDNDQAIGGSGYVVKNLLGVPSIEGNFDEALTATIYYRSGTVTNNDVWATSSSNWSNIPADDGSWTTSVVNKGGRVRDDNVFKTTNGTRTLIPAFGKFSSPFGNLTANGSEADDGSFSTSVLLDGQATTATARTAGTDESSQWNITGTAKATTALDGISNIIRNGQLPAVVAGSTVPDEHHVSSAVTSADFGHAINSGIGNVDHESIASPSDDETYGLPQVDAIATNINDASSRWVAITVAFAAALALGYYVLHLGTNVGRFAFFGHSTNGLALSANALGFGPNFVDGSTQANAMTGPPVFREQPSFPANSSSITVAESRTSHVSLSDTTGRQRHIGSG